MGIETSSSYNKLVNKKGYGAVLKFYADALRQGDEAEAQRFLGILQRSEFSGRLARDLAKIPV
jgi:hypothetical protein